LASIVFAEIWNGRTGSANDEFVRQYKRVFRVLTNSTFDGPETVISTPGLPKRWSFYHELNGAADLLARCVSADAKQDQDDPLTWIVEFTYTTRRLGRFARHRTELEKPRNADNKQDNSPLSRPTVISYATVHTQRAVDVDVLFGFAVVNSAGQKITGIMADDSRPQLTFTRNEATPNLGIIQQYKDAVNSDSWFGCAPLTVKVMSITANEQFEQELLYASVTYVFQVQPITMYSPQGWRKYVLDEGTAELDPTATPANSRLRPVYDKNNRPIAGPVPLDGHGHVLAPGGMAQYLAFQIYPELPFAAFNLP
jgi:hypothetical protein